MKKALFILMVFLFSFKGYAQTHYLDAAGTRTDTTVFLKKAAISGTLNYIPKFLGTSSLGNSQIFDNGTNVGLGTTSPYSQFSNTNSAISGNSSSSAVVGGLTWASAGTGFVGSFYNSNSTGNGLLVKINGNANTQTAFEVLSGTTTSTVSNTHFRILGDGKIGIGTSSPNTRLELASGTAGTSGLRLTNLTNSTTGTSTYSGLLGVNSTGDVGIGTVTGSSLSGFTAGQVAFGASTGGGLSQSSNLFWNNSNNRLGIGTSTPTNSLDIAYTSGLTIRAGNSGAAFSNSQIKFSWGATTDYTHAIRTRHNNSASFFNAFDFYVWKFGDAAATEAGTHVMSMSAITGGVGIGVGVTDPTQIITLNGTGARSILMQRNTTAATAGQGLTLDAGGAIAGTADLAGGDLNLKSGIATGTGSSAIRFLTSTPSTTGSTDNTPSEKVTILGNGNVGIGTTSPTSKFEVNGAATNSTAFNSGSATAILFGNSNLAYTTASAGAFNLQGMKDGGTYTLAVQGTTSGTASFFGVNPSGITFLFRSINNGATVAGKHTLYTFIVMGTNVYYYMATGF